MTRHTPSDLAALIRDHTVRQASRATPTKMIVDSIEPDGLVNVRGVRAGSIAEGPYQPLASVGALAAGDAVWVEPDIGTTGAATYVIADKITSGAGGGPSVVTATRSQSVADTESTTGTVVYVTAVTADVVLGAGTWTIAAVGGLAIRHTAGSANWAVEIDGVLGTGRSLFVQTEMQMVDDHTATGVAGGRTVTVKVRYKGSDPGTTSARNPWLMVVATRQ